MDPIRALVHDLKAEVVAARRELHRIPETGFQEKKTAAAVAGAWNGWALP